MVRRISSSRPDYRVELAVARGLQVEVAGIFLQCVVGIFSRGAIGSPALAQRFDPPNRGFRA